MNDDILAYALSDYAELLSRYGIDSREAEDFYESHKSMPRFMDLAREIKRLDRIATRPAPRNHCSPGFVVGFVAGSALATVAWVAAYFVVSCFR